MLVSSWLPSERAWIDQIAERVFTGEIVLVRSIPRWGLSAVCESVAETLGESAVMVDGRTVTESNQRELRERIDSDVAGAIDEVGCAQLIFDNYGRAIQRSQGGMLHSMLYRILVDSEAARDTGALLVARPGDMLDLTFSGSPLISRAQTVVLPTLSDEDAEVLGIGLGTLKEMVGESTWLARRFHGASARQGRVSAVEHLNNDRRRIVETLPAATIEVLVGARAPQDCDAVSSESLLCLGSTNKGGEFKPSALVEESKLLDEVRLKNPGWPGSHGESVQRFADLLAGVQNAIWIDRYLFSKPSKVRGFLMDLRHLTSARLRLLVSDDRDRPNFAGAISSVMIGMDDVEVRFMNRHDRRKLHDRHLVFPAMQSGVVLPTAGVILGIDDPGSAVSVPMSALAVNYAEYWGRGTRVWPSE